MNRASGMPLFVIQLKLETCITYDQKLGQKYYVGNRSVCASRLLLKQNKIRKERLTLKSETNVYGMGNDRRLIT